MWVKREGERGRGGDMPLRGVAVCEKIRSWHSASAHHGINSARGCGSPMSTEPHATFPPERVSHEYRKEWEGTEENEAKLQARTVPPKHFFTHWGGNNVARSCYTSCTTFCIIPFRVQTILGCDLFEREKRKNCLENCYWRYYYPGNNGQAKIHFQSLTFSTKRWKTRGER